MDPVSIQVFGELELLALLARGGAHHSHCISIRNPDETIPAIIKDNFRVILELRFYDAEEIEQLGAQTIKRIPEPRDVKGVIEFFRMTALEATGYTLHCWQGISRSPAVALGLLYLLHRLGRRGGFPPETDQAGRPAAPENRRVLRRAAWLQAGSRE